MSLIRSKESLLSQLETLWQDRHTHIDAGGEIIRLIINHHENIIQEICDPDADRQFKNLLLEVLPHCIYQTINVKQLYNFYTLYPEVGFAVLREALQHAVALREEDCCGHHSEDPKGYCDFILDVINNCETVSLPWTNIKEKILQDGINKTDEINIALRQCLTKRTAKWGNFATTYNSLTDQIRLYTGAEFKLVEFKLPEVTLSTSHNPFAKIWHDIVRRLNTRTTPAAVELAVVFSEMMKAFAANDQVTGVTIALAAIKLFAERSRLPQFFGGKNRATVFSALVGIAYPGSNQQDILNHFCCKQYSIMAKLQKEVHEFMQQDDWREVENVITQINKSPKFVRADVELNFF